RNLLSRVVGNMQAVVNGISRARWNQMHIDNSARCPGVALVDRISVGVHLERTIEVRALFNRTFAFLLNHPTPKDGLTLIICSLQFEPGVIGIDRAAGEEVADFLCTNHHVTPYGIAAAKRWLNTIQRSGNWHRFAHSAGRNLRLGFLSDGERSGYFRLVDHSRLRYRAGRRQ